MLLFALISLTALLVSAKTHRYDSNSSDSNSSYINYSDSNSNSDSNSVNEIQGHLGGLANFYIGDINVDQAEDVINNATIIQENIDLFSGLVAMILNSTEHQNIVRDYTRRIRNIVALIDVSAVRNLVSNVVNEALDSLRSLRNTLRAELVQLNESNNPIYELDLLIQTVSLAANEEYHHLKGYLIDSFINITHIHKDRLSLADEETIADVRGLLEQLIGYLRSEYIVSTSGLHQIRRVLNLQRTRDFTGERVRLENLIRLEVQRLIQEIDGVSISRLRSIVNSAVNVTFEKLSILQDRVLDVSRRALEHHQPGSVLAEELLLFREGLGQSFVEFHQSLQESLLRLIRDVVRRSRISGTYGGSIEVYIRSIVDRVRDRVENIQDLISRVSSHIYIQESFSRNNNY